MIYTKNTLYSNKAPTPLIKNIYARFLLFKTTKSNLKQSIDALTDDDIFSLCSSTIYHRGEDYYNEGAIEEVFYSGDNQLNARVIGSLEYEVKVQLHDENVSASCTCPFDGVCKHIIAVLLYVVLEEIEEQKETIHIYDTDIREYLNQLSKKELMDLVERFAPEEFRIKIQNQFIPEGQIRNTGSKSQ